MTLLAGAGGPRCGCFSGGGGEGGGGGGALEPTEEDFTGATAEAGPGPDTPVVGPLFYLPLNLLSSPSTAPLIIVKSSNTIH